MFSYTIPCIKMCIPESNVPSQNLFVRRGQIRMLNFSNGTSACRKTNLSKIHFTEPHICMSHLYIPECGGKKQCMRFTAVLIIFYPQDMYYFQTCH